MLDRRIKVEKYKNNHEVYILKKSFEFSKLLNN